MDDRPPHSYRRGSEPRVCSLWILTRPIYRPLMPTSTLNRRGKHHPSSPEVNDLRTMSTKTTKASNKIRASAPGRTAMKPIATLTNGPALLGYARVVERTFAWMTRWRRLVRLRRAHRLFRSHDPRRSRKRPAQANSSRIGVFKRTLRADAYDFTCFARPKTAKLGLPLSDPMI